MHRNEKKTFWMSGVFYDWDSGIPVENQHDYAGTTRVINGSSTDDVIFETHRDENGERCWNVAGRAPV